MTRHGARLMRGVRSCGQHPVAATDVAGAAHRRPRMPLSEALARRKVVMAPKAPDFPAINAP